MARLFVSFVHEDEKLALAVQDLLQTELNLREEVFLSSDKSQIYAGDLWLQKIKEALSAAEIVILMLSQRSVARPWVNFEAGAAWLANKTLINHRRALTVRAGGEQEEMPWPLASAEREPFPHGVYRKGSPFLHGPN